MEQVKQNEAIEQVNTTIKGIAQSMQTFKKSIKEFSECLRFCNNGEVFYSPYEENEKRVINGKIVDVTYRQIDWKKNFKA